ncbi:DUF6301 family protein [Nocardia yamanashiensis]|uniref:DUF6301 family protein n=1 Tax=Nocardia yamanashiensis TaxID=209247 RepID=UPI001E641192|nr:DUF6301 family protein [Nocardia yamanashiensis]UGT41846.1 DUF6301 family protein [Nocardia yamanashiensis]
MSVDVELVARIAAIAAEFDWTWSEEDTGRFSAAAGWHVTERRPGSGATMRTTLPIEFPFAFAHVTGDLKNITLGVSDKVDATDLAGQTALFERFRHLGRGVKDQLGDARIEVLTQGFGLRFRWSTPKVVVDLMAYPQAGISLRLTNPEYDAWMQAVTAGHDDVEWVWGQETEMPSAQP